MKSPQLLAAGTATINMTPMIDVVFLLIIFFLVSSHLAKQENSIELDLPKATSVLDDDADRETVVVNVLADGAWSFAGRRLDEQALMQVLAERVLNSPEIPRLRIRTDRQVPYRRLEPILGIATRVGIGDIVFSVYEDRRT